MGELSYAAKVVSTTRSSSKEYKIKKLFPKHPSIEFVDIYEIPNTHFKSINMNYGDHQILNKNEWDNSDYKMQPYEVELVFSLHPSTKESWYDDFELLIKYRLESLMDMDLKLQYVSNWNIVIQENKNATNLFHGYIVKYNPLDSIQSVEYKTALNKKTNYLLNIKNKDKTISTVLERHEWDSTLLVTDITGSMDAYLGDLMAWLVLNNSIGQKIRHVVMFNDGDGTSPIDKRKNNGDIGGVYTVSQNKGIEHLLDVFNYARSRAKNHDSEENDFEALYKSFINLKEYKDVVLIVDANKGPRDKHLIKLLRQFDIPVKVILCGGDKFGTARAYFKLAKTTKGSLHTMKEDLNLFIDKEEGQEFEFTGRKYRIENGEIVRVRN